MLTQKQREHLTNYFNDENFEDKEALAIYPFRYETIELKDVSDWVIGDDVVFEGMIVSPISIFRRGPKQAFVRFEVQSDDYLIKILSFNPYIKKSLEGQRVTITGKVTKPNEVNAKKVNTKPISEEMGIFPVYPLKGNVKQFQMRQIIKRVYKENAALIEERVPHVFLDKYRLLNTKESLKQIHFPTSKKHLDYALRTLKYSEFLDYQTALALQKKITKCEHKPAKKISSETLKELIDKLPFKLTEDQTTTLNEIISDMQSSLTMTRLVQGDVGSGKTVLAYLTSIIAVLNGYQVAFLCPTEVLMKQHYDTFKGFISNDINLSMLSSSFKTKERNEIEAGLENGTIDICIGTHTLFSESTSFKKLGCVIIDEQHRFGVAQRQALIHKGKWVDTLMMSATPIPRTLASVLYAHLDVSTIETMPESRKQVTTILQTQNSMMPIMDSILTRIQEGDQCYVVCPAVSESTQGVRNVEDIYRELNKAYGGSLVIERIHGQLKSGETDEILARFKNQEIDILITTTVIEVGIHVGTANTMVIYDADRFGLAQIHQLRGRIGREGKEGLCYLLTKSTDNDSLTRLQYVARESDGFKIAAFDLKMRGSGDLLGERQSGIPNFILSDIVKDQAILVEAKKDAEWLLEQNDTESQHYVSKISNKMDSILMQAAI